MDPERPPMIACFCVGEFDDVAPGPDIGSAVDCWPSGFGPGVADVGAALPVINAVGDGRGVLLLSCEG